MFGENNYMKRRRLAHEEHRWTIVRALYMYVYFFTNIWFLYVCGEVLHKVEDITLDKRVDDHELKSIEATRLGIEKPSGKWYFLLVILQVL